LFKEFYAAAGQIERWRGSLPLKLNADTLDPFTLQGYLARGLGARRALKTLDPSIHAFRDTYLREDFFFSRELNPSADRCRRARSRVARSATMKPVIS